MGPFSKKKVAVGLPQIPVLTPLSFRYYRNPIYDDESAGPGLKIEIPVNDDQFLEAVTSTLDAIFNTAHGRLLIEELVTSGREIRISKTASRGNSCDVGPNGLNLVARELADPNLARIGLNTRAALGRVLLSTQAAKYAWLAAQINSTPDYQLKGEPSSVGNDIGITAADVESWFRDIGRIDFERGRTQEHKQHLANAIIVALEPYADPGPGCGGAITFNSDPNFVSNTERPPGIGLAHELIHAYWSVKGQQVGWTVDAPTTVLFEYKCVGLGCWDSRLAKRICENQIRDEWFASTAPLFKLSDRVNRSSPVRRAFYTRPDG